MSKLTPNTKKMSANQRDLLHKVSRLDALGQEATLLTDKDIPHSRANRRFAVSTIKSLERRGLINLRPMKGGGGYYASLVKPDAKPDRTTQQIDVNTDQVVEIYHDNQLVMRFMVSQVPLPAMTGSRIVLDASGATSGYISGPAAERLIDQNVSED